MRLSQMQCQREGVLMAQTVALGTRRFRWRHQGLRWPTTSRRNFKKLTGRRKKRLCMWTSSLTSEESFMTSVKMRLSHSVSNLTATLPPSDWQGNFWTKDRQALFIRAFDNKGARVWLVFGQRCVTTLQ